MSEEKEIEETEKLSLNTLREGWSMIKESLQEKNILKFLPLLTLLFVFSIIFIYKNHQVARTLREIGELKREINELRAEESAIKFDLMNQSRQSKIIQKLDGTGIRELRTPPYKIKKEID